MKLVTCILPAPIVITRLSIIADMIRISDFGRVDLERFGRPFQAGALDDEPYESILTG
jgi:hypothetical protein